MGTKNAISTGWQGSGGPRVLIENPDFGIGSSAEQILLEHGFRTAVCGGPDRQLHRRCPLVTDGECQLATDADVVVHSLNPDRPEHAAVLAALKAANPRARIVVEIPKPAVERHRDLLEGCSILVMPATSHTLLSAVQEAAASVPG